MKRLFCFMLVVIMALSLAACGTKATEDDPVKKNLLLLLRKSALTLQRKRPKRQELPQRTLLEYGSEKRFLTRILATTRQEILKC